MPSVVQQRSIAASTADWSDSVTLDQTDPATGVSSITLALTGTLSSTLVVHSLEQAASRVSSTDVGSVTLNRPDGTALLTVAPFTYLSALLPAATGPAPPEFTLASTVSETASATYTQSQSSSPDATLLLGLGKITLPVVSTARVTATAPGNFGAVFDSQVGTTVATVATSSQSGTGSLDSSVFTTSGGVYPGFLVSTSGTVTTARQHVQIAPSTTGWSQALGIAGFDPTLGALQSVNVTITTGVTASLTAENLDPAAAELDVTQTATVNLNSNGAVLDSQVAMITTDRTLAAFDGTPDDAGASGETLSGQKASTTATQGLYDTISLAAFTGPATAGLTVAGVGQTSIVGPGALSIGAALQAGAGIDITYTYVPTAGALFDASYYLAHNPDVAAAGVDPYQQYLVDGWKEGRNPSALFNTVDYLRQNPDVAAAGVDPLLHYVTHGVHEGRAPTDPLVDAAYYDQQLGATPIATGAEPAALSFDASGWQKGLNPDAFFDTNYYLSHNPDIAAAHIDPLLHYESHGWKEGRDPSASFSTDKYLTAYADVRAAGVNPLLHFVEHGQSEHRSAFPA